MATTTYDTAAIIDAVQVAPPGLMLERAEVDSSTHAVHAVRGISIAEPAFAGHFPGHPILPGVLQVDAMRQAGLLALHSMGGRGDCTFLRRLAKVKFRQPVAPGDRLSIALTVTEVGADTVTCQASTRVGENTCCEAVLTFSAHPPAAGPHPDGVRPGGADLCPLDTTGIEAVIPHRPPFLFIDRMLDVPPAGAERDIVSLKQVTAVDTYLAAAGGSVPPPHLVEIAAQTGCAYLLGLAQNRGKLGFFMSIDEAEYFGEVRPGDEVLTRVQIQNLRERFGKCHGKVFVNGTLIAWADVKFAFVEQ